MILAGALVSVECAEPCLLPECCCVETTKLCQKQFVKVFWKIASSITLHGGGPGHGCSCSEARWRFSGSLPKVPCVFLYSSAGGLVQLSAAFVQELQEALKNGSGC